MKDGFIKVSAGALKTHLADTAANIREISSAVSLAEEEGVDLLVLPELCVTGYSCGDLFFSEKLLSGAEAALAEIAGLTLGKRVLVIAGAPLRRLGKLYNCAVAVQNGRLLAAVPKTFLPNYNEFYEKRQFSSGRGIHGEELCVAGQSVPFGTDILLQNDLFPAFTLGLEVCEDLWAPVPPCERLALAGAAVIANCSASNELIGKADYRRLLVSSTSARLLAAYVYSGAGEGESTQDVVYSQHCIIAENGTVLAENPPFGREKLTTSEIDLFRLLGERHKNTSFEPDPEGVRVICFSQSVRPTPLTRCIDKNPFVPASSGERSARAESILRIQASGLARRVEHTRAKCVVIGISGGLDSCLALLVAVRAFDMLSRRRGDIVAVTMPCFGTTSRTRRNAETLCRELGVSFREVDIGRAVTQHFADIGHDESVRDVTYENSQARERTQVIMDIANELGGFVVGTGDLSELALGWATYNGDHMSMYGVNASVPKTLVRYIVRYEAENSGDALRSVLLDILATPVSPELLPAESDGSIAQKTEELVGPYELHDFFLYYMLRFGFSPAKIYRLAKYAFSGEYDDAVIKKWLVNFVRRFFSQQFKRSCLPDGPKVGSASLSPRGDWRMPSDAVCSIWLSEAESL